MIQLAALSLTPLVDAWLRQKNQARVLNVFEHAVNLNAGDEVLSLVTPQVGNGPFNVVLPACDFRRHITLSDTLTIVPNAFHIGDLVIDLSSVTVWNPYPNWPQLRLERARLRAQTPTIHAVLHQQAPANSLAHIVTELPTTPRSSLDARLIKVAQLHWNNLYKAIVNLNQAECMASAKRLVGLGNGLTPSGDDWLVGCGLAAQLNLPSPETASLILKTINHTASDTTLFSSYWLQATIKGMCNEHWHKFFAACLQSNAEQVYQTTLKIVEQGHSSGADALAGYLAVLEQ